MLRPRELCYSWTEGNHGGGAILATNKSAKKAHVELKMGKKH